MMATLLMPAGVTSIASIKYKDDIKELAPDALSLTEEQLVETLRMICADLFPEGGDLSGDVSFWTGLRPKTPDCTPVIGKTKYPKLFINAGHGTLGWTMACGAAQLSADLIANKTPEISIDGLDITRY